MYEGWNQEKNQPIFNKPNRYPIDESQQFVRGGTYHELITVNLMSLVPNIDMGYHNNMNYQDMVEWIDKAETYSYRIHHYFQMQCLKQHTRLTQIEEHRVRSQALNVTIVEKLPDDIIRIIHDFLLPETKIELLLARYPMYQTYLRNRLNTKQLTQLQIIIFDRFYNTINCNQLLCILNPNQERLFKSRPTYKNKILTMTNIGRLLEVLRTAKPNTQENHRYFQTSSLKLVKLMIYLGYHCKKRPRQTQQPQPQI
jgi:hypothetical protein